MMEVNVKPLEWDEPKKPDLYCSYDYTKAIGAGLVYQIEWKSWEDYPGYTLDAGENMIGCFDTLEAAKSAAFADYSARIMSAIDPAGVGVETLAPSTYEEGVRAQAIEDVLSALTAHELYRYRPKAFEGFIHYARETLIHWGNSEPAQNSISRDAHEALMDSQYVAGAKAARWRMFEDTTPGYWGIELENAGNDDDAILYPQKIQRDTVVRIVEAHNAALTKEGEQ